MNKKNASVLKQVQKFVIFTILFAVISCGMAASKENPQKGKTNITVQGTIKNAGEESIIIEKLSATGNNTKDTLALSGEGKFTFTTKSDTAWFYRFILLNKGHWVQVLIHPGDKLSISGDANDKLTTFSISGNPKAEAFQRYLLKEIQYKNTADSIRYVYQAANNENKGHLVFDKLDARYKAISKDLENYSLKFINEQANNLASLIVANNIDQDINNKTAVEKMIAEIGKAYPKHPYLTDYATRINALYATSIGGTAPNISLVNPEGKIVDLESLRGKVVLIDFWATWCGPCRGEIPYLKKAYAQYKSKGFEIYSVSSDKDVNAWKMFIEANGMNWTHVIETQNAEASRTYQVSSIPRTYLLDKQGKIVAMNLRGESLLSKLAEIIK